MHFRDLNEAQLLALAITSEEEDGRIYRDFAEGLRATFPATAELFTRMADEESDHRHRLLDLYRQKFGDHVPLIRRQDVDGFNIRRPSWLFTSIHPEKAREEAALMEQDARRFYEAAVQKAGDAAVRQLLGDLANEELKHEAAAESVTAEQTKTGALEEEHETARRLFVLRIIQPGLAGLMDGSVSTLAPALRRRLCHRQHHRDLQGRPRRLRRRGHQHGLRRGPLRRWQAQRPRAPRGCAASVCGLMTTLGGIGHTLPYLIRNFHTATGIAIAVVIIELGVISWIRYRYMDSPLISATLQVIGGGLLVFLAGWLIGAG